MQENELQTLKLEGRKRLTLDGVLNVESFSEEYLELSTKLGTLEVEGSELKIVELRQSDGEILICGTVNGVFYRDTKISKSLLKKIFK
ncbi:MAG: YabP/YqfC family sporulation protein [Clostridia bacterium]|nr:YabP/YqfC family sporulation protein [Clostridia bacterium]